MSPAPIVSTTSPSRTALASASASCAALAAPRQRSAGGDERVGDEARRHPGDRLLARRIDLGQKDHIRRGERRAELAREVARAREEVRLKRDDDPTLGIRDARRRERRRDLRRVVRVVVDHDHAARFAEPLEATLDTRERREARRHLRRPSRRAPARSTSAASALSTLCRPGICELDRAEVFVVVHDVESVEPVRREHEILRARGARRASRSRSESPRCCSASAALFAPASSAQSTMRARAAHELRERALDVGEVGVDVEVIGLDVGDDGDGRRQREKRAIVFVRFDDVQTVAARAEIPSHALTRPPTSAVGSRPAAASASSSSPSSSSCRACRRCRRARARP